MATQPSLTRHDLLLAGIALSLVLAAMLGVLLPVKLPLALGAGSVPATGGMGYALFYRPPVEDS